MASLSRAKEQAKEQRQQQRERAEQSINAEAELIALSFCADEGLWMRNLLNDVGITQASPTPTLCAHQGTVSDAGLRVPAIIEWPAGITEPRVTSFPASPVQ